MICMPVRQPRNSPNQPQSPERSALRLPLSDAQAQLDARIAAGRTLMDTEAAALEAQLATSPYVGTDGPFLGGGFGLASAFGAAQQGESPVTRPLGELELEALSRKVSQWQDYNRTWLRVNLTGEAAEEYQSVSTPWGSASVSMPGGFVSVSTAWGSGGADNPQVNLRRIRQDVESEIAKLESIRERLPMWELPGSTASTAQSGADGDGLAAAATNQKLIMVVYGHDGEANNALFDWLRAIGLQPLEWSQVVGGTGHASPYIGQALDEAFQNAQAVVAFFTPDERVIAIGTSPTDPTAWRLQARPNVLIEAGMALNTHPDRTVLVVLGDQELPSDLAGRHYIRLRRTSAAPLHDLASRLKNAGCDTDTTGSTWLDPSRFPDRDNIDPMPRALAA
jgi:predicted nucleotide-binding protein